MVANHWQLDTYHMVSQESHIKMGTYSVRKEQDKYIRFDEHIQCKGLISDLVYCGINES